MGKDREISSTLHKCAFSIVIKTTVIYVVNMNCFIRLFKKIFLGIFTNYLYNYRKYFCI